MVQLKSQKYATANEEMKRAKSRSARCGGHKAVNMLWRTNLLVHSAAQIALIANKCLP